MVPISTRFVPRVWREDVNVDLLRPIGVPVRDQLAGDLFRLTLFHSQGNQGQI